MKKIEMLPVNSSNIVAVGWDNDDLYVKYNSGVYVYSGVDKYLFEQLLQAESKGRFLSEEIKPVYKYKKLENKTIKK